MTKRKLSTYKLQTARCNTHHCMHFIVQQLKRCLHNHLATWQPALQAVQQPAPASTPHHGSNETHRTTCSSNEPVMHGIAPTQCHCWALTVLIYLRLPTRSSPSVIQPSVPSCPQQACPQARPLPRPRQHSMAGCCCAAAAPQPSLQPRQLPPASPAAPRQPRGLSCCCQKAKAWSQRIQPRLLQRWRWGGRVSRGGCPGCWCACCPRTAG